LLRKNTFLIAGFNLCIILSVVMTEDWPMYILLQTNVSK
jgi:hypothetical protein